MQKICAPGAMSATCSDTPQPWFVTDSRKVEPLWPDRRTLTVFAGSSPAAIVLARPMKPRSTTAILTPAPVEPASCRLEGPGHRRGAHRPQADVRGEPAQGADRDLHAEEGFGFAGDLTAAAEDVVAVDRGGVLSVQRLDEDGDVAGFLSVVVAQTQFLAPPGGALVAALFVRVGQLGEQGAELPGVFLRGRRVLSAAGRRGHRQDHETEREKTRLR